MADVTIALIKELREKSGAGMMDCKKALVENGADVEKAMAWLREKGIANAGKKASRVAAEGMVDSYIHMGGKVGVLVEVNIETDFAAKNAEFRQFVHDVAMQVAAMSPKWVAKEDVPAEALRAEEEIVRRQIENEGKKGPFVEKIVEGRMKKFYAENCLVEQSFIKDESKTIDELTKELIAKIGENIKIRRFTRYALGEGIEKKEENFAEEVEKQLH